MNRYDLKGYNLLVEDRETLEYEMTDVSDRSIWRLDGKQVSRGFFTPYHLSEVCAMLALPEADERGIIRLNEPSCGGGASIIAAAWPVKRQGINYQRKLEAAAQDLDWKGYICATLQLSLWGSGRDPGRYIKRALYGEGTAGAGVEDAGQGWGRRYDG